MKYLLVIIVAVLTFPGVALANTPPVADAGPDVEMYLDDDVMLEGSATDADGDPITLWEWTVVRKPEGSAPWISDPNRPNPVFCPDMVGDYVLSLVVSDGTDYSAPDLMVVRVYPNEPPTAVALSDVTTGDAPLTVSFDGSQSTDPEGRELTYRWRFGDGYYSDEACPTHTYERAGSYSVRLQVTDDVGQYDFDYITIEVTVPSADPATMIGELVAQVEALNLHQGIDNSLDAKLEAALGALADINQNNDVAAVNSLQAFINAVQAQSGSKIPEADAQTLIAAAQAIIDALNAQ
jgi:PKD repeat protein